MIHTERDKTREVRKLNILKTFVEGEKQYTNQVAKKIGVVWPVADRLLKELVREDRLMGDKLVGYQLKKERESVLDRIKKVFNVV